MASTKASVVRVAADRKYSLTLENIFSIGVSAGAQNQPAMGA
jgi:hypothetical protein